MAKERVWYLILVYQDQTKFAKKKQNLLVPDLVNPSRFMDASQLNLTGPGETLTHKITSSSARSVKRHALIYSRKINGQNYPEKI